MGAEAARQRHGQGARAGVQVAEDAGPEVHATLEESLGQGRRAALREPRVRLSRLGPEIVEPILDGRQPAEMQLDDLLD
jgi:hypothetical protein